MEGERLRPGGGFFLSVNLVFLSQAASYGLAFLLRVVLARGLGDEGLGTYSLFFITVLIAAGIGNLGVGLGNIYFLNKGTYRFEELMRGSFFVIAVTAVISTVIVIAYGVIYQPDAFVSGKAFWLYAPTVPVLVAYLLLTSFLHGESRFLALSVVASVQGLASVLMAAGLWGADALDVFGAAASWIGAFLLADLLALALIGLRRVEWRLTLRPAWPVLREQVKYGAQGQLANLAQLFNYRLDQYLVVAFVTRAGVGHYTVAVGLAESVWWISTAVAMVLLPRLTYMEREQADELAPLACRNTLIISIGAAVALMALSPFLIRGIFGNEFSPAVMPLILLMPGIVAASAARVIWSYLFSQGKVIYNTLATLITLGVTVVLDLALIPILEVNGAAIASSIAYTVSLGATLYWYQKVSPNRLRDALLFRPSDIQLYVDLWRRLRTRLVPADKAPAG
ncbi:MAG: polysaccharide biosynthesis C-terminal domain-containing protein [Chloroflexi bacterium]|nr:polysaccharide biosynthesis C-terminal domain-containing protein [Chloroflexota bacterium]